MSTAQADMTQQSIQESESFGQGSDENNRQYLTFELGGEHYGVDILRVQEIKGWVPVTHIPNTPNYLRGVLNLRGAIVPIVDLRMRFNLDQAEFTSLTVIIVLSVHSEEGEKVIGVVVDSVSDVLNVDGDDIKPTPELGANINTEFLRGLGTSGDQMVMLLDIDKMLASEEVEMIAETTEHQETAVDKNEAVTDKKDTDENTQEE